MDKKQLITSYFSKHSGFAAGIVIGLIVSFITRKIYFEENSFLQYEYLGEAIVASIFFLLVYFYGRTFVKLIVQNVEKFVVRTVDNVLQDFWKVQSKKLVDAIKKEGVRQGRNRSDERKKKDTIDTPKSVLLDTSALIDGRVFGLIKTGFMDNRIIVTQNVIDELQAMADSSDNNRRTKGRRGLDKVNEIKRNLKKDKFVFHRKRIKSPDVDKGLIEFCIKNNSKIMTLDYNLNKAAQIAGVEVLNINKLVNEIKTTFLPGDILKLKLIQKGKEDGQAIGYLEDGTMIVVNNGKDFLGKEKDVMVEKVLQTSAGKMIFAKVDEKKNRA